MKNNFFKYGQHAILFLLLCFPAASFAGNPVDCLRHRDPIGCIATEAISKLDQSKDGKIRAENYGDLLVTLAEAGHRQDSIYSASEKVTREAGTLLSQWQLMVGRYTYALRFFPEVLTVDDQDRIFSLTALLDKKLDPSDTLLMKASACSAREAILPGVRDKWGIFLDAQCRSNLYDLEKLDNEDRWLWITMAPLIDAYNRDRSSLDKSLGNSFTLSVEIEKYIKREKDQNIKKALMNFSLLVHVYRAYALAIFGPSKPSMVAALAVKGHLEAASRLNQSLASESLIWKGMIPAMLARVGLFIEAETELQKLLGDLGSTKRLSIDDTVTTLIFAIEAQSLIRARSPL